MATALFAQNNMVVLSAAGGTSTVSPGSLATAYLTGFDASAVSGQPDQFGNFPTDLGGYYLNVNGNRAQLLYVGGTQINFFVPADAQLGDTEITVFSNQMVARGIASVRPVAPSIFTIVAGGRVMGAALNAVTFRGGPFRPETPEIPGCDNRTRLALFATGIGLSGNRVRARDVRVEAQDSTGAVFNLDVDAAVPAPGFASLEQLNVTLASGMYAGPILLRVIANGVASNRVQVDLASRDGATPSGTCLGRVDLARASDAGAFNGTVSLAWPAGAGGVTVQLTTVDPSVKVPASVIIAAGKYSVSFPVTFTGIQVPKKFSVTATVTADARPGSVAGTETRTGAFEEGTACVDGIGFSFPGIVSGNNLTGRITLTDPAPPEGAVVSLSTNHSSVSVGSKMFVPAGQTSAIFAISTGQTTSPALATVIATGVCGGSSAVLNLVVTPCIVAVSISATAVAGGGATTGTVTLNAPALAGGQIVTLHSSDPGVQIDSQVRVEEGQISANFAIKTSPVTASRQANILGTVGNCGSASASMMVNAQ